MWRCVQKRTLIFAGFMSGFLLLLLYLTWYSHIAYFEGLPRVETVMPERTEDYVNGRYLYVIPEAAVQREIDSGKLFIYTAREYRDILGERNLVTGIPISVEKRLEGDRVLVDGIVREEPVITEGLDVLFQGQAVVINCKVE